MPIVYHLEGQNDRLAGALKVLADDYSLVSHDDENKLGLVLKQDGSLGPLGYAISKEEKKLVLSYGGMTGALRGLGSVISFKDKADEQAEDTCFESVGIMLDCSRNAVPKRSHIEMWMRKLALLGYNQLMLYTEDTYELEGEPYFGYQRGGYTAEDIRDLDDYAYSLGIELVPCIQTLGHLHQMLKWSKYWDMKDTNAVMMVRNDRTYEIIEKMISLWSENVRSKRIHIGMDETHDLGLGRFLDQNGFENRFDLFNYHLDRVVQICNEKSLKPMIWSDMYFRLGSKKQDYYDREAIIPDEVKEKIPVEAELVYWDYYHDDADFYAEWIDRHRELGKEPIMASGVWTWPMLWHCHANTDKNALPCVKACKEKNVKEITFTMWGDDGALCDIDSAFEGLATVAESIYSDGGDEEVLAKRFSKVCKGDYNLSREASILGAFYLQDIDSDEEAASAEELAKRVESVVLGNMVLWDDPLQGVYWRQIELVNGPDVWEEIRRKYGRLSSRLNSLDDARDGAGDLKVAGLLADAIVKKIGLRQKLVKAYEERDDTLLREVIVESAIVIKAIERWDAAFTAMWHKRNRPQGLEQIQIRIAGVARRFREVQQRVEDIILGHSDMIDELEVKPEVRLSYIPQMHTAVASAGAWTVN
ncbi:Glycosyl hydrolase family 20, catalytic domain [Poriferisphaera corsica]|uniref:Glycosyl hydrolase family 20, catalytic domain n=1 Tax=Poriferisphaera corsica TaxID=2528020 RepID=A0A517YWH4_9BACT|nr:beta-N-acetylhexosaminidase [Poriferisphaera corsica]QDU34583.1 Glycosyl hydrolase family 20, catalytic domain [Poriferisphaera corsica]